MKEKKVYDFPFEKVKDQVVTALKRSGGRSTPADVVTATGLPRFQVEKVLPVIADQCRGQLQVTESGEILYYFPQGLTNRETGALAQFKRFMKATGKIAAKVLAFLFKVWMMAMLVVYFVIFLTLLLVMIIGAFAASLAKRDEKSSSRDDSGVGFYFVMRLIELAIDLWVYSGAANRKEKKKKPFYRGVFDFVFGVAPAPEAWDQLEKKALIAFIQHHKGAITGSEVMSLTGRNFSEASALITRMLREYNGDPRVTEDGTLFYFFPELLKTAGGSGSTSLPVKALIPFSNNPKSVNRWVFFLNLFNTVFAAYFITFGIVSPGDSALGFLAALATELFGLMGTGHPEFMTTLVLGVIPGAYSVLFFGIPLVRRIWEGRLNKRIQETNLRRKVVQGILARPEDIRLETIRPSGKAEGLSPGASLEKWKEGVLRDLAQDKPIDLGPTGPNTYQYQVKELSREMGDIEKERQKINPQDYALGAKVFDSAD